ncbi:E3 ubiquitin-protein ligase UBR2 [Hypsibius exemplaris]|uniref:E3 ubiquitin-protein ligase n=1 Tax=Hypsibius exemplaris TaxID=2072580 RepID=A0A9X6NFP0_HYPEX|nr:E3 ubiquitin-protein ligase UBR2 [Hypsibius exemplaris]
MEDMEDAQPDSMQEILKVAYLKDGSELEDALRSHWRTHLMELIPPGDNPRQLKHDAGEIRRVLLKPLEVFIAGTEQVTEKFASLKKDDLPSFLCNRSFRSGEPTYSCRDCAVDSTCVLCIECFKKSAHQNHRYKISSSSGGGYCDCGDPEAWKKDFACALHQPPSDLGDLIFDLKDAIVRVPDDVANRFKAVIKYALIYVYQVLTFRDAVPLPGDLSCPEVADDPFPFVTVLYNDEVHTYDGVIATLSLTLECSPDDALEYATVVDHEGRTPVKFASQAECKRVKKFVEQNSKRPQPLRLDVVPTCAFAHQVFALHVMKWVQDLAETCEGFKALVCTVCQEVSPTGGDADMISVFLLEDVRLWKAARKACHSLFMSTFLTFNDAKIRFSSQLARLYPQLMADFITDDHDHSDSCTSLTVQLFTVPTVARTLFERKLVDPIIKTLVAVCRGRVNDQGMLSFERVTATQPSAAVHFKRALFVLYDARYLLNTVPTADQWTEALRVGFLGLFDRFLEIMVMMEGMDHHTRRTQSHVEYESDWEPAFNMQLRIGSIIDLLQQWCASDDLLLGTCMEKLMVAALNALGVVDKVERKVVAGQSFTCLEYDVATQVVSVHHPVIRLLAGLVVHGLAKTTALELFGAKMTAAARLRNCARELLEFPLRTMVLVAQASAGMWRRNGYALANQIFFYHQPRCREEMLDKDIVMMQSCAAVMPPDSFLIAMLDKFGLVPWADETFDATPVRAEDDSIRQVMCLAEEFLNGLIVLVGERFYPNVGRVTLDDCLKNEIIHQLCKESMSYPELLKFLPEQEAKEAALDDLIKEVATFKKPSPTSKGTFELKPELNERYNMFFYHYTRTEHSKAEDTQRKRRKKAGEEVVFPPPCPPEFTDAFSNIIHLLDCDVFIHLLNLTLRRALISHPRSFSEGQLIRMLYLVGYGLHEEKRQCSSGSSSFPFKFVEKAADAGVFMTLRELRSRPENEAYKSLVEWMLRFHEDLTTAKVEVMDTSEEAGFASAEKTGTEEGSSVGEDDVEEKKKRSAARRERIMQQMQKAQQSFATQNEGDLQAIALPDDGAARMSVVHGSEQKERIVALGPERTLHHVEDDSDEKHTCILCSESHAVGLTSDAFVAVAYVQRSTVLSQEDRKQFAARFVAPNKPPSSLKELCQSLLGDQSQFFLGDTLSCAPHVSSCGHLLHLKCWKTYFESVLARERRRSIRLRTNNGSFDVNKSEFRCPLCSRLCNAAMPFCPKPLGQKESSGSVAPSVNDVITGLRTLMKVTPEKVVEGPDHSFIMLEDRLTELQRSTRKNAEAMSNGPLWDLLQKATSATDRLQGIDMKSAEIVSPSYAEAIRNFDSQVYQLTMNATTVDEGRSVGMNWSACSYSIQSIETCLRSEKKSLLGSFSSRQFMCLKSLIRATSWSSAAYDPKVLAEYALRLYAGLLEPNSHLSQLSDDKLFEMDAFALLVNLTCAFPWLPWRGDMWSPAFSDALLCRPPGSDVFDHSLLSTVYVLHVLQTLVFLPENPAGSSPPLTTRETEIEPGLRIAYGRFHGGKPVPADLELRVRHAVWPFLRCAAIFYHFLTGMAAPKSLRKENQNVNDEYDDLMSYLALPRSFTEFLSSNPSLGTLGSEWVASMETALSHDGANRLGRHPRPVPTFAPLPRDYTDIIHLASQYSGCKIESDERRSQAFCLMCGEMLCSQSMCCQFKLDTQTVGACTYHSMTCGGGTGLFLRVRDNQILLLHGSNKGCFVSSPYVDAYGEPDPFLRRGNPLQLSQERLDQILRHYLHHDIADEVSHAMDQNGSLASLEWFHF